LILGKITKIVVIRCHILKLKCTKLDFRWGSVPDTSGGAYSAPPDPLAGFKGDYFYGKEGEENGKEGQGMGEWRGGDLLLRRGEG